MLFWLVFLPLLGGLIGGGLSLLPQKLCQQCDQSLSDQSQSRNRFWQKIKDEYICFSPMWFAFMTILVTFIISVILACDAHIAYGQGKTWEEIIDIEWIPLLGIHFHLVLDGFSLLMTMLTTLVVSIAILYSRKERHSSPILFYLCILFMTSAVIALFTAKDLFLLFFLWEAITIPVYFLITLWGQREPDFERRFASAGNFLIYNQIASFFMLISIVSLALMNWKITNQWTFNYYVLIDTSISSFVEFFLMLGFLVAFIVRIPLVPFHRWFIDTHITSSTTGSIIISSLLVNSAIYCILQFAIPMFPNASVAIMPVMLALTLITLFYTAFITFSQNDITKLIAYAHIALMSFITAIIYAGTGLSYYGVVLQIIAVTLTMVGLFIISGLLVEYYGTRDIRKVSSLKNSVKHLSFLTLFFILAIIGVPGTVNFTGNLMMLFGSYESSFIYTVFLVIGLFMLSISIIIRIQPIFYGAKKSAQVNSKRVSFYDLLLLIIILCVLFAIGLYPQWVIDMSAPVVNKIQQIIVSTQAELVKGDIQQ